MKWWEITDPIEALRAYERQGNTTYNRTKVRMFERLLGGDLRGKTVLDYGGGAGFMSLMCARMGAQLMLVEPDPTSLRLARYQIDGAGLGAQITCVQSDCVPPQLLRDGRRFDIVLLKDLLEHVPDDGALLREVAALQSPGDRLLLSTPNRLSLTFALEGGYERLWAGNKKWLGWDTSHVRMHTPWSLSRVLRRSGYEPTRWWGLYVIPYDILSWLTLRRRKVVFPSLHRFDLTVGRLFPFNRLGWNIVLEARRSG